MEEKIHSFTVFTQVPERLKPLEELAYNLWFSWNTEAVELFQRLDPRLWEQSRHNPVLVLSQLSPTRLSEIKRDEAFLSSMERVYENFRRYVEHPYFNNSHYRRPESLIAYFSAEYGLTDCLPFYHGGLGVLAGDHLKAASDLNIPLVGVGLLCHFGAYRQMLTIDGEQREIMPEIDLARMPIRLEKDSDGNPLTIRVEFKDEEAIAHIWRIDVGRIPLYLLDTNIPQNPSHIREVTIPLYAEDRELRLRQEILLGIGGVRALKALGLNPTVYHMNEGHSGFTGLERIRQLREEHKIPFNVALLMVLASNCFTTHTSVPAGIDLFDPQLIEAYFARYLPSLGISMSALLGLGRRNPKDPSEPFCMNILAMKLSGHINAVSHLHRRVSQGLWQNLWPSIPVEDVPIAAITNGIHVPSWITHDTHTLFDRYLGPHWPEDPDNRKVWSRVTEIPNLELWNTHERRRQRLVSYCRRKLQEQLTRRGASSAEVAKAQEVLDPDALTIVWARRMTGYKRPTLIFRDCERLAEILGNPTHPVQIIIAGKAHPNDEEAKASIKEIITCAREERFRRNLVFIEDYDFEVARHLVEGADVWLNTPRRPNEACGTSGMKAIANGALHMSTLDGWWAEAYSPEVGWLIGRTEEEYTDINYQDEMESKSFYNLLEQEVVPLFYDRGPDGLPSNWIEMIKNSMRDLCPRFTTHRMMEEYIEWFYLSAQQYVEELSKNEMAEARGLAEWFDKIKSNWSRVSITEVKHEGPYELRAGEELQITSLVHLGKLAPGDVKVEVYYGLLTPKGDLENRRLLLMEPIQSDGANHRFRATLVCNETGKFGYRIRVTPHHPHLMHTHYSLGQLVTWG